MVVWTLIGKLDKERRLAPVLFTLVVVERVVCTTFRHYTERVLVISYICSCEIYHDSALASHTHAGRARILVRDTTKTVTFGHLGCMLLHVW